jgi:hypothetical protein
MSALKAYEKLNIKVSNDDRVAIRCFFLNPAPNYYDGKLATMFETTIKDKFEGLHNINEIDANYIKRELAMIKQSKDAQI